MWKLKIGEGKGEPWLTTVNDHVGRQHWVFDPEAGTPEERAQVDKVREHYKMNRFQTKQSSNLLMIMQLRKENPIVEIPEAVKLEEREEITEEAVTITLRRAISFLTTIQAQDGHWPAECSGGLFYVPQLVITLYITGSINSVLSSEHKKEMKRYMYNCQNEDGGWGFHREGHSTMFGSIHNYVGLRLLGEGPDDGEDNAMARGRQWILDHGTAISIPSWGKYLLAMLGVYEWEGCNPVPPEFCLVPNSFPVNPGNLSCYSRMVFIPLSYIYGRRFVGELTPLVHSLREELYTQPYHRINWNNARNTCAKVDIYYPHPMVQDILWGFLHHFVEPLFKHWPLSKMREKALKAAMELIHYEDINSRYICLAIIEKVLCMIACWAEDPNSEAFKRHLARIPDYFWVAEDGMKIKAVGCQTWEVSFAVQAIFATGLVKEYAPMLKKAYYFLKVSQIKENPSGDYKKMYRHISKGGWGFETGDQGWQVSDCTGECLEAVLLLSQMQGDNKFEDECLYDAVNLLLSFQSKNGGFSAWEPNQAFRWIEKFNPLEVVEDVLIETEYVECTSSVIQSLALFKKLYPMHRSKEIENSISRAIQYVEQVQNVDGSWYGSWGICYTYGAWYGVKALAIGGKNYENSNAMRKACDFLLSKQLPDGGWGESYLSSTNKVYTNLDGNRSNLVNTSWALMALLKAGQANVDPIPVERGVRLLINSQLEEGRFPQQEINSVFMRNGTIHYATYVHIFPVWALGEYRKFKATKTSIPY